MAFINKKCAVSPSKDLWACAGKINCVNLKARLAVLEEKGMDKDLQDLCRKGTVEQHTEGEQIVYLYIEMKDNITAKDAAMRATKKKP